MMDLSKNGPMLFPSCSRANHDGDTVICVGDSLTIGGDGFCVIAGPCAVESEEQIFAAAKAVKEGGAHMLRGGAFKPRTSPYAFQGLGEAGLELLLQAGRAVGLPVVSEITAIHQLPLFGQVDMIQIGARNMQNFDLLREVGRLHKPILLKRSLSATLSEWLLSAEYILSEGNGQVILCERGIRTHEPYTRNTLDLSAVPALRQLTHLPVLVDPSHGTGRGELVPSMTLAAAAAGANGVMLEVHCDPDHARSDGSQSLTPAVFAQTVRKALAVREVLK